MLRGLKAAGICHCYIWVKYLTCDSLIFYRARLAATAVKAYFVFSWSRCHCWLPSFHSSLRASLLLSKNIDWFSAIWYYRSYADYCEKSSTVIFTFKKQHADEFRIYTTKQLPHWPTAMPKFLCALSLNIIKDYRHHFLWCFRWNTQLHLIISFGAWFQDDINLMIAAAASSSLFHTIAGAIAVITLLRLTLRYATFTPLPLLPEYALRCQCARRTLGWRYCFFEGARCKTSLFAFRCRRRPFGRSRC